MAKRKKRKLPRNCRRALARCRVGKHGKLFKCRKVRTGKHKRKK